jgi:DNA-3-methyladenine glycosylase II
MTTLVGSVGSGGSVGSAGGGGVVSGVLAAAQPFDLRTSIRFLEGFGACRGDQVLTGSSLTKAVAVEGQVVVFRVVPQAVGVGYELVSAEPIGPRVHQRVCALIDGYLSLSDDLSGFYAVAAGDVPRYAALVRSLHGLHQVRFLTLAEIGVWAVLSQRTPKNVSVALKRRITTAYGRSMVVDGVTFTAFPELADLAGVGHEQWLALVRNARKAEYLTHLVAGLNEIGEDYLRTAPYEQATRALRTIKGVGEFSAAAILLRGLGRMDFVPLEMANFTAATAEVYGPDPDNDAIRARYGPHLGYWAYYLHTGLGALRAQALPPTTCPTETE